MNIKTICIRFEFKMRFAHLFALKTLNEKSQISDPSNYLPMFRVSPGFCKDFENNYCWYTQERFLSINQFTRYFFVTAVLVYPLSTEPILGKTV